MLSKLDKKVREIVANQTDDTEISDKIANNPLVTYLKLFQKQHRLITILYKGLILAFSGFVILLSLLIINIVNNQLFPWWGAVSLTLIDILLVIGIIKAYLELSQYRDKSATITEKIHEFLKSDISKLEKFKEENRIIDSAQKRIQKKINLLKKEQTRKTVNDYKGWDRQICPICHASVEMTIEECPNCHHSLGRIYTN